MAGWRLQELGLRTGRAGTRLAMQARTPPVAAAPTPHSRQRAAAGRVSGGAVDQQAGGEHPQGRGVGIKLRSQRHQALWRQLHGATAAAAARNGKAAVRQRRGGAGGHTTPHAPCYCAAGHTTRPVLLRSRPHHTPRATAQQATPHAPCYCAAGHTTRPVLLRSRPHHTPRATALHHHAALRCAARPAACPPTA